MDDDGGGEEEDKECKQQLFQVHLSDCAQKLHSLVKQNKNTYRIDTDSSFECRRIQHCIT